MSTTQERIDGTVDGQGDAMRAILDRQRHAFAAEGPPSVAVRRNRIDRLLALVLDNADAFVDAMAADFGTRPKAGSLFTEILGMISVIEHTRSHVLQWMQVTKLMRAAWLFGLKAEVQPSPLGVIGIIGPWNFPLNLVVLPAAAAFAAGNRVMIKMSEITPATAQLMKTAAPKYFEATEFDVVTGGPDVAAAFATLPFGAYHGKAGFDAFSHYRAVVGSDLPFTITGCAAPPFSGSMRAGTALGLRMARNRTRRRLKRRR